MVPRSLTAMTAMALPRPLAVRVVPSMGSTAMSVAGPWPSPTDSPLNSMGASSFSPSPMTTMPSMGTLPSVMRMASTAAPSAPSLSPRPIHRDAAMAAASVTRTMSSARLRSGWVERGSAMARQVSRDERAVTVPNGGPLRRRSVRRRRHHGRGEGETVTVMAGRPASGLRAAAQARLAGHPRYRWIVLVSVLFGLLSVNITFTVFNVALVGIAQSLHTTQNTLTWAITGPLLLVGVAAPTAGKIGDLRGHRRLYLFGLSGALLCAVLTAAAPGVYWLIGARLLSGVEGACTTAASWSLLFRVFPPTDRTKVLGWWSLVGAGGPVLGVALGGPLIQAFGWRWIFVAQAPLVAAALILNAIVLPETEPSPGQRLDVAGAGLLALAVGSLLFGLNRGTDWGWTSPAVLISLALCPVGMVAFVAGRAAGRGARCCPWPGCDAATSRCRAPPTCWPTSPTWAASS